MRKNLKHVFLIIGMASSCASAHVGYGGRNFGTFENTQATSIRTGQAVTGNFGWIDGADFDYGDSHKLRAYRFTLLEPTNVTLRFEQASSEVTDHLGNVSTSQLGLMPGFSLYQGLAHIAPLNADYDSAEISVANRPPYAEGSFRALADWSIGNDPDNLDGLDIPASLSILKYIGHAYDGTTFGADGSPDGKVTHTFTNLAAGDYSVFVGGADYFAQNDANPDLLAKYGVSGTLIAASPVPEPQTYAMLLTGLGLMGATARRHRMRESICRWLPI